MNTVSMKPLLLILLLAMTSAWAGDPVAPRLDIGKGGKCVEDPKLMRRNHMDILRHQRDETMRSGVRGSRHSLVGCVDCHASSKNNSVLGGNENFCQGCHAYAGVRIDCFECHSSKRKTIAEAGK
jgi:cytochrome c553